MAPWLLPGSRYQAIPWKGQNLVKVLRFGRVAAVLAVGAVALSACGGGSTSATSSDGSSSSSSSAGADLSSLKGTITAGGSSAQANAQDAWKAGFKAQASGVTINYDKSQGSGGGVTNFNAGSYDFAGTDFYLNATQATAAKKVCGDGGAVNLPVYTDGVSIIFNVKGVDKLKLDEDTIVKIFTMKIKSWDDPAIKALNPDVTLPSTAITTVSRSDGSGTTNNFTNYLHQLSPAIWTTPANPKWPIAGSSAQQGNAGVVNTVKSGDGMIGYADHSAIGDVHTASIKAGSAYVDYSQAGVTKAIATAVTQATTGTTGDLAQDIDYTKLTDGQAYPIPLMSYDVVCKTFKDPAQAKLTKEYIKYIVSDQGQKIAAKNAGSAPIPTELAAKIVAELDKIS